MSMTKKALCGVFPAFPTPTDKEGRVDAEALIRLVRYLLDGDIGGLVPVGGTGEFTALSPAQRRKAVEVTVAAVRGRVPVVPGILCPGFAEAVETGRAFAAAGADALMLVTPFYVTPTQGGIRDYFKAYRDKSDLPVLLYDIPSRTRVAVEAETIAQMADDGSIIGMKACNTDVAHFNRVIHLAGDKIAVMSGEDLYFPTHIALGGCGGVLASATIIPRHWVEIFELLRSGHLPEALARHRRLLPLFDALFAEVNPGPLKEAMRLIGLDIGRVLLPLKPPMPATMAKLEKAVAELRAAKLLDAVPQAA